MIEAIAISKDRLTLDKIDRLLRKKGERDKIRTIIISLLTKSSATEHMLKSFPGLRKQRGVIGEDY